MSRHGGATDPTYQSSVINLFLQHEQVRPFYSQRIFCPAKSCHCGQTCNSCHNTRWQICQAPVSTLPSSDIAMLQNTQPRRLAQLQRVMAEVNMLLKPCQHDVVSTSPPFYSDNFIGTSVQFHSTGHMNMMPSQLKHLSNIWLWTQFRQRYIFLRGSLTIDFNSCERQSLFLETNRSTFWTSLSRAFCFEQGNLFVETCPFKINRKDYLLQHLKFIFFQSYVIKQRQHLR